MKNKEPNTDKLSTKGKDMAYIRDNLEMIIHEDLSEDEKTHLLLESLEIAKDKTLMNNYSNKKSNLTKR
jgi:hypothetical protein